MRTPHYMHRLFQGLIVLSCLVASHLAVAAPLKTLPLTVNGHVFTVEVADKDKTRTQGLSGRADLAVDHGMLFAFAQPGKLVFWMPDMHFSLDIIWLDADQHVLGFIENVEPCIGKEPCNLNTPLSDPNTCHPGMAQAQCPLLPSPDATQYVLELPAGSVQTLKMQVGTPVAFDLKS